jgi:nitrite reductase/ring-hydroxylating ferredoxin subunit
MEALIVLRRGPQLRVFHNVCPHAGRRLDWAPGQFLIDQQRLVCAAHGACFSLPDGLCVEGPCRGQSLAEVPVCIIGDELWLEAET